MLAGAGVSVPDPAFPVSSVLRFRPIFLEDVLAARLARHADQDIRASQLASGGPASSISFFKSFVRRFGNLGGVRLFEQLSTAVFPVL